VHKQAGKEAAVRAQSSRRTVIRPFGSPFTSSLRPHVQAGWPAAGLRGAHPLQHLPRALHRRWTSTPSASLPVLTDIPRLHSSSPHCQATAAAWHPSALLLEWPWEPTPKGLTGGSLSTSDATASPQRLHPNSPHIASRPQHQ